MVDKLLMSDKAEVGQARKRDIPTSTDALQG